MDLDAWLDRQIGADNIVNKCYGALFYDELEEYDAALDVLNEALRRTPTSYIALNNRGVLYWEIGEVEKSVADLIKACELTNTVSLPHKNLGEVFLKLGRFEDAKSSFLVGISIDPTNPYLKNCLKQITD
jgi:tetratricopeptide (TPR) repeat protein